MNALKVLITTLTLATASTAFANEGVPPDLQARWAKDSVKVESAATRAAPRYLPGLGEETLVPNPDFVAPRTTRLTTIEIQRHSVPATTYVGA